LAKLAIAPIKSPKQDTSAAFQEQSMLASDQFKAELRQKDLDSETIVNALKVALTEAIELKITTRVNWSAEPGDGTPIVRPAHQMQTRINIVDGDIENEIGAAFLSEASYADLREFHLGQVRQGREIVGRNLESIQKLFGVLVGTLNQLSEARAIEGQTAISSLPAADPPSEFGNGSDLDQSF
jgi:hypothetical protein